MVDNSEQISKELRDYAIKSIKRKRDFKQFVAVYIVVNTMLSVIWFLTTPNEYFWPVWVMFGMGIALVFSYIDAYIKPGAKPITDEDIAAELSKLNRKNG
jgi:hypothetical protein